MPKYGYVLRSKKWENVSRPQCKLFLLICESSGYTRMSFCYSLLWCYYNLCLKLKRHFELKNEFLNKKNLFLSYVSCKKKVLELISLQENCSKKKILQNSFADFFKQTC